MQNAYFYAKCIIFAYDLKLKLLQKYTKKIKPTKK